MNDPALYASLFDMGIHGGRYIVEEFADELGQISERCIDIGSGPGRALVEFILPKLDPRSNIVCSDISERMVNFAKETYGDNDRLSFLTLDIETRSLPNDLKEQFNHVISLHCLHWCQDMCLAFENIFNLLQPGGTALVSFISDSPVFDGYNNLAAMPRYQPYMKDWKRFVPVFQYAKRSGETLRKIIKDVGFDIRHVSERQVTHVFKTQDILSDFLASVNPFIERMPADLREEYKKDLAKDFVKNDNVFQKRNMESDYSTLLVNHVFILHLQKPFSPNSSRDRC